MRVLARPRLRDEAGELACLMRVLHNTFLSGRRDASRRPRAVVTLEDLQVLDWHATQAPQKALEVEELYAAIAGLPERCRRALVAVDLLGLSYAEAAACSVSARRPWPRGSSVRAGCSSAGSRKRRCLRLKLRLGSERVGHRWQRQWANERRSRRCRKEFMDQHLQDEPVV
jgi:Sigma-70, region 4